MSSTTISNACQDTTQRVPDKITLVNALLFHESTPRVSRSPSLNSSRAEDSTRPVNIRQIIDAALAVLDEDEDSMDFSWGDASQGGVIRFGQ
eukprot:scaffold278_cov195-Amphora_coffeaeformis.AAC.13